METKERKNYKWKRKEGKPIHYNIVSKKNQNSGAKYRNQSVEKRDDVI